VTRLGLALALPAARRAAGLPAVALAGGATLCLIHVARLAPGADGAAVATSLATTHGWWVAAVLAAALPVATVRGGASGGTPHTGPLGRFHAAPGAVAVVTAVTGLLTLLAGLVPLLLAAGFGGGDLAGRGLVPGAACLGTVIAVASAVRRLGPTPQLLLHYAALAAVAALLWGSLGW
jgi:hypothetical protein